MKGLPGMSDKLQYRKYIQHEVYRNLSGKRISAIYGKACLRYLEPSTNAVFLFRKMQYLNSKTSLISKIRTKIYKKRLATKYGILASPNAKIEIGLHLPHPTSIVIGQHVVAGKNLSLYQNTTLGGVRVGDVKKGNQPILGDNVTIFANSAVLGKVVVDNNVIVGANSLLLDDAVSDAVYGGCPAKLIKRSINNSFDNIG